MSTEQKNKYNEKSIKIVSPKRRLRTNIVYQGDNLELMKSGLFPPGSIDCVYIDPPFCTQRKQTTKAWSEKIRFGSYDDTWGGGISSYQLWLRLRIQAIYNILKPDGSLFLHLDYNAAHYGKIVCDEIFGEGNKDKGRKYFMNEIIWCFEVKGQRKSNHYHKTHNNILWYSKDNKRAFTPDRKDELEESTEKRWGKVLDKCGGKITYEDLKKYGPGSYEAMRKKGRVGALKEVWISRDYAGFRNSWWNDIVPIRKKGGKQQAKEPYIYTTQKPLKLLRRILKTATKEGQVVADFFCGCGVALTAAKLLNRKYIGVDKSKDAITALRKHLLFHAKEEAPVIKTENLTRQDIAKMSWPEYQDWAVRKIGGEPAIVKNKGPDGFMPDGSWIEVKKWKHKAGISSYRQVLEGLEKTNQAYIIAKDFSNDLKEKKNQLVLAKGWDLNLIPEEDLLRDLAA